MIAVINDGMHAATILNVALLIPGDADTGKSELHVIGIVVLAPGSRSVVG